MCIIKSLVAYQQSIRRVACDKLGSVDISREPYKSGDKAEKSKITDS